MTLRGKLLLAQAPLLLVIGFLCVLSMVSVSSVGGSAQKILRENYQSVLAAQHMKEAVERLDSSALFYLAGQREKGIQQAAPNRRRFEAELKAEEGNITEPGEREASVKLRRLWEGYKQSLDALFVLGDSEAGRRFYFRQAGAGVPGGQRHCG